MQLARRAFSLARANTGNKIDASIAIIAITTKSSIRVKALLFTPTDVEIFIRIITSQMECSTKSKFLNIKNLLFKITFINDKIEVMENDLSNLPIIELKGNAKELGEQLGELTRLEIQELYELRLKSALRFARENGERIISEGDILSVARRCLAVTEKYDAAGYDEFLGIARGAQLLPEKLFVTQGLTDLRDVMAFSDDDAQSEGCSSFIIDSTQTAQKQVLLGQNWDLQRNNMPYVRLIHRKPTTSHPESWSLTLTGCLTLIGMNSEGIAVGNTNLKTKDARIGLQYLSVLHRALRSRSFEEAVESISAAPRSAAHYYYLADRHGQTAGLECSATKAIPLPLKNGMLVHCNHALHPDIAELEVSSANSSTCFRQTRLSELIQNAAGAITVENLKEFLSDHAGGADAICRHAENGEDVATNACVIMSPQTGEFHACRGQGHLGQWRLVSC
jgi:isopenicillin-N N-acyltransferase-like protein